MSKAFGFLLLLLGLAATAMWLMQTSTPPRGTEAPELLPEDTLLLAQLPDVARTRQRWRHTSIAKLLREPEIRAFLERPREQVPALLTMERMLERLDAIEPGEAFVAIASMKDQRPSMLAGIAFSGDLQKAQELFATVRLTALRHEPRLATRSVNHHGIKIESYISSAGSVFETIHRGWYLVADEIEELKGVLDRMDRRLSPQPSLKENAKFQRARAKAARDLDASIYADTARLEPIARPALETAGRALAASTSVLGIVDGGALLTRVYPRSEAVFATTQIEGAQFRDTIFVLQDKAKGEGVEPETRLQRATLALTDSSSVLYYATKLPRTFRLPAEAQGALVWLPGWAQFERSIAKGKVTRSEFDAAFGPEMGIVVNWPPEAIIPNPLSALEIRDPEKAAAFIAKLVAADPDAASAWTQREQGGVTIWETVRNPLVGTVPALALSEEFLVFGLSADAVARAVKQLDAPEERLDHQARFATAINAVQPPSRNFAYVDLPNAVNRLYDIVRPLAAMALTMDPNPKIPIDPAKLPPGEVLTRHLTPIVYSESPTADGYQVESVGSLTMNQALVAVAGGAAVVLGPSFEEIFGRAFPTTRLTLPGLQPGVQEPDGAALEKRSPEGVPVESELEGPKPKSEGSGEAARDGMDGKDE